MHDSLGLLGAVLITCTALPLLAALVHAVLDSQYLDLEGLLPKTAIGAALLVPALMLPGAFMGWSGTGALLVIALLSLML